MVYRVVGLVVGVGEVVVVPPPVAVIILHLRRAVGGDVDLDTVNTGVKQAVLNTLPPIVSLSNCTYLQMARYMVVVGVRLVGEGGWLVVEGGMMEVTQTSRNRQSNNLQCM